MTLQEFKTQSLANWDTFVAASNTNDPEVWDTAFASYTQTQEHLNDAANGHPHGKPRPRPS